MKSKIAKELKALCHESEKLQTKYYSLKDLEVNLLQIPRNPYIPIFEMALQTWANPGKWKQASPELRFEVVKGVLDRKALPLGLETPKFSFQIKNTSRAVFDQIARARIGVVFAGRGFKDNNLHQQGFVIPDRIPAKYHKGIKKWVEQGKKLYGKMNEEGVPNWACRSVVPMYSSYNFIMSISFAALQKLCGSRMETTEMPGTVALAWLLRKELGLYFPLLANYLRPNSDWSHRDTTMRVNGFSNEMGVPHSSDFRHEDYASIPLDKVKWDEPCTDIKVIAKELNIKIPAPHDWLDYTWEILPSTDKLDFLD